ncbi:MAG: hypothetical protein K9K67_04270 [Bacteriovoracaceae bacterium]|nr:hypothetical protein [Bacteriovoracaceae bacterium]
MHKNLFFIGAFSLLLGQQVFSSPELEAGIEKDKSRIERSITKAQRSAHKNCDTKLKFNITYSELENLEIQSKFNQFDRLKKKLDTVLEEIFSNCKSSSFKQKLKKYKEVQITAVTDSVWRVKAQSGKIMITIANSPGKSFSSLLQSKIR